jgi:hypothetical protein
MVFFTRTLQLNPEGEERKKEEWKKIHLKVDQFVGPLHCEGLDVHSHGLNLCQDMKAWGMPPVWWESIGLCTEAFYTCPKGCREREITPYKVPAPKID